MTQIEQTGNGGNFVAHKQVGFTYNKNGQFTGLNRFNQHVSDPTLATGALAASAYDYDAVGRLTDLDHVLTGITLAHDWGYDRANRVDTYLNSLDGAISYDYDESGQLEEVSGAENNTYTYDDNGNRIGTNIVQGDPNRIVSDGTWTYAYDDEGNLTSRTATNGVAQLFTYDYRNRLTKIELVNGSTTYFTLDYQYDTFNRRVSRTRTQQLSATGGEGGGPITEITAQRFVYDGDNVVFDFDSFSTSFVLARRYLFGPQVDQILAQENVRPGGQPILLTSPARVYWTLTDNLGSVRDLMANDGTQVYGGHYKYDVFGRILDGDTPLTRYLFTGREYDLDTELQYNRNRWYDPASGRFLSEDPIGFAGDPSNLYRYVGNGPTNATDPSGLYAWSASVLQSPQPTIDGTLGYRMRLQQTFSAAEGENGPTFARGSQTWQVNVVQGFALVLMGDKIVLNTTKPETRLDVLDITAKDIQGGSLIRRDTLAGSGKVQQGRIVMYVEAVHKVMGFSPFGNDGDTADRLKTGVNRRATPADLPILAKMIGPRLTTNTLYIYLDRDKCNKALEAELLKASDWIGSMSGDKMIPPFPKKGKFEYLRVDNLEWRFPK
jgi:RHS repeat-associated protein